MLGVGIGFASFIAGWALHEGIATSFSRMGADLVIVPRATLVNITSSLLTVQPTDETLPASLAERIAATPGVALVAPQRIVPSLVEGRQVNLVAFDPARDFSVLTWLEQRQPGSIDGLIAGGRLASPLGTTLSVCGRPMSVYGRLGITGVGPFDESYFLSFDALADIVSFCRMSATAGKISDEGGRRSSGRRHEPRRRLLARPGARPGFGLPAAAFAGSKAGAGQVRAGANP